MEKADKRPLAEVLRDEMAMQERILGLLKDGEKTIPEMAASLGLPAPDVTFWVMAQVRYGKVAASDKADAEGYFRYRPTE